MQSINTTKPTQWHCYPLLHRHINPIPSIIVFLWIEAEPLTNFFECNVFHLSSIPKFLFVHEPNNKCSTNPHIHFLFHILYLYLHTFINQTQSCKIPSFCLKFHAWMSTTCSTSTSKSTSKISFFLSSIAIMLEMSRWNKQKQEKIRKLKRSIDKRRQENGQTFKTTLFGHILTK